VRVGDAASGMAAGFNEGRFKMEPGEYAYPLVFDSGKKNVFQLTRNVSSYGIQWRETDNVVLDQKGLEGPVQT
jgi:hypothetical protein